jgi:ubiquitin C-terminal hydrolase
MLIDRLQTRVGRDFVHGLFGGTTADTIAALSDDSVASRDQRFYTFLLPITGASNALEAFEKFQAVDFLTRQNQYLVESFRRKIDAKKFASLGNLPPHLIIQLSPFTSNY